MITGIYILINKINQKIYIGQALDIESRWLDHGQNQPKLKTYLKRAINKYGWNNFEKYILELCEPQELNEKEVFWINYCKSNNSKFGYNLTKGGKGTFGYKHKKETLDLFSLQRKGKKQTKAQYKTNCDRIVSLQTKTKMSNASKGKKRHSVKQLEVLKNQEFGARRFLVTFPDKQQKEIKNLSKFCKLNNLDRTSCTKSATLNISYKGFEFKRL